MRVLPRIFAAFLTVASLALGISPAARAQAPAQFQHPGVLVSQAQLDYIKIMVADTSFVGWLPEIRQ